MRADKVVHRARTRVVALPLLLLVGAFAALPVSAAVYTVTMKTGSTFDTRYQPEEASWDENMIVLMTEFGNRIAFGVYLCPAGWLYLMWGEAAVAAWLAYAVRVG